jgi:hypothetical protein
MDFSRAECFETTAIGKSTSASLLHSFGIKETPQIDPFFSLLLRWFSRNVHKDSFLKNVPIPHSFPFRSKEGISRILISPQFEIGSHLIYKRIDS